MILTVDEEVQGFSEEYTSKEELLKRLETLLDDRTEKVMVMKRATKRGSSCDSKVYSLDSQSHI